MTQAAPNKIKNRLTVRIIAGIIFLFLQIQRVTCQEIFHRRFETGDGLPSNNIYDVARDSLGRIWVATENGVSYYDGGKFVNLHLKDGLPELEVFLLDVDKNGNVWMFTSGGEIVIWENGRIWNRTNHPTLRKIGDLSTVWFRGVGHDINGHVWLINQMGRFFKLGGNSISSLVLLTYTDLNTQVRSGIQIDRRGLAWVMVGDGLLCLTRDPIHVQQRIKFDPNQLGISVFLENNFFIQYGKDLAVYPLGKEMEVFHIRKSSEKELVHLQLDPLGNLWVSDFDSVYVAKNLFSDKPSHFSALPVGYKTGKVLFQDGNELWMTSLGKGLYYYPNLNFVSYPNVLHGGNNVHSIFPVGKQKFLLSGDGGCVSQFQKEQGSVFDYRFMVNRRGRSRIKIFPSLQPDALWFSGENGLFFMKKGAIKEFYALTAKVVLETPTHIWLGSSTTLYHLPKDSLQKFSEKSPTSLVLPSRDFQRFYDKHSVLPGHRIFSIERDDRGFVWVGSNRGLFQFDSLGILQSGNFRKSKLINLAINDLKYWKGRGLLCAIKGAGIILLKDQNTYLFKNNPIIKTANINKIILKDENAFWLATDQGLFLLREERPLTFSSQHFSAINGLAGNQINDVVEAENEFLVACDDKISIIPKDLISKNPEHYVWPQFPSLEVKGQEVRHKDPPVEIEINEVDVRLRWGCTDYAFGDQHQFRYRFSASDPWKFTSGYEIRLSNLRSGYYHPELQARNPLVNWSNSTFFPSFRVLPPLWRRTWFLALAFLSTALISIALARYQMRQKSIRAELDQKLIEANLKALRAQVKPHFFFNALNSVSHFFINHQPEAGLEFLNKFSTLVRNILDGSDLQFHSLAAELELLENYISIERERIGPGLQFKIEFPDTLSLETTLIPTMLIQPLVENAIWHGIWKKVVPEGWICVRFEMSKFPEQISEFQALKISVLDNGIGLSDGEKEGGKGRFGLASIQSKLDLLARRYKKKYALSIFNLRDELKKAQGTKVEIIIPLSWEG